MTALPSVPQAIRVTLKYTLANVAAPIVNAFHLGYSIGDIDAAGVLAVANALAGGWTSQIGGGVTDSLHLAEVIATSLSSPTAPQASVTTTHTGTVSGQPLPPAVALIVQRHVGRRYRGGHSRIYIPGVPEAQLTDGATWTEPFAADIAAAWEGLEGIAAAAVPSAFGTAVPTSISYFEGFENFTFPSGRVKAIPKLRTSPLVDPIVAWFANPRAGSQRRRNSQGS